MPYICLIVIDLKYSQGTKVFVTLKKMREIFTPIGHTLNRKNGCRARVWSIKAGKIGRNRNKQTSDQKHERKCKVQERKKIRAVCVLTPCLFSHSTLSSRLGC